MPPLDPALLRTLALLGLGLSITTLVALPAVILRLPTNQFARQRVDPPRRARHPILALLLLLLRNALGAVLFLAGIAMLVLPGQGILSLLAGLAFLDFPGKRRLELALVSRPMIWNALQSIRRRGSKPPFER